MAIRKIRLVSAIDLRQSPVQMIDVMLRCNGQRQDVVLDGEHRSDVVEFTTAEEAAPVVEYQYRAYTASKEHAEQQLESPLRTTDASVIVIDASELFRVVTLQAVATCDPARFAAVFVDFRLKSQAAVPQVVTLDLTPERRQLRHLEVVPGKAAPDVEVRLRYVTRSGELLEQGWQPSDGTLVVAANPVGRTELAAT